MKKVLFMLLILILFILLIYIALKKNHKKFILNILFLSVGYILLSFFLWHRYDRALWNLPALFYSPVRNPQNMVLCVIAALVLYGIVLLYLFISNRGYIVRTSHFNKRQWVAFFFLMLFIFAGSLITPVVIGQCTIWGMFALIKSFIL